MSKNKKGKSKSNRKPSVKPTTSGQSRASVKTPEAAAEAVTEDNVTQAEQTMEESKAEKASKSTESTAKSQKTQKDSKTGQATDKKNFFENLSDKNKVMILGGICILCAAFIIFRFVSLEIKVSKLDNKVSLLETQKQEILDEKDKSEKELNEQIALLSEKVAMTLVKEDEEEANRVPSGLPVTGKVSIIREPLTEEQIAELEAQSEPGEGDVEIHEDNKIVVFGAQNGSTVIAAGQGSVTAVEPDETYGYVVKIDHGNGYETLYRTSTAPKVKVGDEVLKGQLLFDIDANNSEIGYQILYKEECINPMDIMEING